MVSRSACLLACERSNIVVVTPSAKGRRAGGKPAWFMTVLTPGVVDDLADYIRAGGPGIARPNDTLQLHETYPGLTP